MVKKLEELQTNEKDLDRYKVRKLYHDATDDDKSEEWYFDMEDGDKNDKRLENVRKRTNLKKENDDSWSATGVNDREEKDGKIRWKLGNGQVRLEGWSEPDKKKWSNMEITVYGYYDKDLS